MEIVRRAASGAGKFKVIKPFMKGGRRIEPGEEMEIKSYPEADGLTQRGLIIPCDLPSVGVYIVLKAFSLPGSPKKYEAKPLELVSLRAEDALPLMLAGVVIPKDESRWRPANRRLRTESDRTAQR